MINSLLAIEDVQALAQAVVNTVHEPFLVLDADLRVIAASRSFYEVFQVDPAHTRGCLLYDLGDGQWDVPALRRLLETIIPEHTSMDEFEVDYDFPQVGRRTMLLNARMVLYENSPETTILLAFTDVTARRAVEHEMVDLLAQTELLLRQKKVLLQEMEHRIANSLQIIASILLLKAKAVKSLESREHLRDAHDRVMSVAAVQAHLHGAEGIEKIRVGDYLTKLCGSLGASMIGGANPPLLEVISDEGVMGSAEAVSLGLIVTELVINALKYAFPGRPNGRVRVSYESNGDAWKLAVCDNGVGKLPGAPPSQGGLGTIIVAALVTQLGAELQTSDANPGVRVEISHSSSMELPQAA